METTYAENALMRWSQLCYDCLVNGVNGWANATVKVIGWYSNPILSTCPCDGCGETEEKSHYKAITQDLDEDSDTE